MRNSMLKRAVGALLCTAVLLASFSVYAFAAKEPQNASPSSATVSLGVQTAQFVESRTEIAADGTQRQYGTLAFSFEVENASFEAHLPIILKKLPDGSTQYETTSDWFNVQAKPNRNATLPAAQQEAVPKWYVEQAQCTVYESNTKPACLVLTVQGVLQDENWNRVPFSGSSEYYF